MLVIQLLNGLSYGVLLFLLAAGLSLIFGLMNIVNMAHGSYYFIGAYIGYAVFKYSGNFLLALLASGLSVGVIGLLMDRFLFRYMYKQELEQVLLTFGFIYIFEDICKWIWGGSVYGIDPPAFLTGAVTIMGSFFPIYRLCVTGVGMLIALGLWFFQEKTIIGAIIRAGTDDEEMVRGLGINIAAISTLVFAMGAALAGLSGAIGAPMLGIYPGLDLEVLILALIVVVVGGLGSLQGAFWGSLFIGMVDSFGKAYFPDLAMFTVFGAMALILLFKPSGLLGRKV
jgi:branched-chain amino acid transport system permease protein